MHKNHLMASILQYFIDSGKLNKVYMEFHHRQKRCTKIGDKTFKDIVLYKVILNISCNSIEGKYIWKCSKLSFTTDDGRNGSKYKRQKQ